MSTWQDCASAFSDDRVVLEEDLDTTPPAAELRETVARQAKEIDRLNNELRTARGASIMMEMELDASRERATLATREAQELKERVEKWRATHSFQKVRRLYAFARTWKRLAGRLRKERDAARKNADVLLTRLHEALADVAHANGQAMATKQDNVDLRDELDSLSVEHAQLREKLRDALATIEGEAERMGASTLTAQATESAALVSILRERVQSLELDLARHIAKGING